MSKSVCEDLPLRGVVVDGRALIARQNGVNGSASFELEEITLVGRVVNVTVL